MPLGSTQNRRIKKGQLHTREEGEKSFIFEREEGGENQVKRGTTLLTIQTFRKQCISHVLANPFASLSPQDSQRKHKQRGARLLIAEQLPNTAGPMVSFQVDSDIISLDGKGPLQTDAEKFTPFNRPRIQHQEDKTFFHWFSQLAPRLPFLQKILGTPFTMDAFRYGYVQGCSACFLTHFHCDHYAGLTKGWSQGPICSTPQLLPVVVDGLARASQAWSDHITFSSSFARMFRTWCLLVVMCGELACTFHTVHAQFVLCSTCCCYHADACMVV